MVDKNKLLELPYAYEALEPYIDAKTMEIHYTKHHQSYFGNVQKALEQYEGSKDKTLEQILANLDQVPEAVRTSIRNNGGGHFNHTLFWQLMTPDSGKKPVGSLAQAMEDTFGNFDQFKQKFTEIALGRFGSGWAWLALDPSAGLVLLSTPNQDNPVSQGLKPILGLDVWEHAYYLKYHNRRPEYVEAWWNVVNWQQTLENFEKSK